MEAPVTEVYETEVRVIVCVTLVDSCFFSLLHLLEVQSI